MDQRLILVTLLIRLGVAAAISSVLVRARRFRVLLFREERTVKEKLEIVYIVGTPIALGVLVRGWVHNFLAADIAFVGAILMGVIGGRLSGAAGGLLVGLPSLLLGEWLAIPMYVLAGTSAGFLRHIAPEREAIWSFSPLFDLSIYHWIRRSIRKSFIDWQTSFFFLILALEFIHIQLHLLFPRRMFALYSTNLWVKLAIYAGTVMAVAIALKVLNNVRIEMKLEQQERLLLQARMEALQSQINPHFLFNTLNSIASLVRADPDSARLMIVRLGNILRRLLRKGDSFVPLREEFDFLDDYLDIEVARFGRDKLRVVKELEPSSLDLLVPSMILQPLVENAVKHGFASKVEAGTIYLRSRSFDHRLVIEVEDDGVGMPVAGSSQSSGTGIGMLNVTERLQVVYGDAAELSVSSEQNRGTLVRLVLPVLQAEEMGGSVVGAMYEERGSRGG
ncbi:MAG TPA: histidine kinase [Terriglobales bacterium]|nr:histidine kinase [Terriglobales bacterium]